MSAEVFIANIPERYEDIKKKSDEEKWSEAINEEIQTLEENKTF